MNTDIESGNIESGNIVLYNEESYYNSMCLRCVLNFICHLFILSFIIFVMFVILMYIIDSII